MISTVTERYGRPNVSQSHIPIETWAILSDKDAFSKLAAGKTSVQIANELGIARGDYILKWVRCHDILDDIRFNAKSAMELDMKQWLDTLNVNYAQNTKKILPNKQELDFYFPDHGFAIELDGLFHHSEIGCGKDRGYHWNKYKYCNTANIQLLRFWQNEYWAKKTIIRSKILYKLGLIDTRVHARRCQISIIKDATIERDFLEKNHIQGFPDYREHSIAAYHAGALIGMMQFAKTKGRWELIRYATDINSHCPGLFSKMMQFAVRNFCFDTDVVSFSDNRISNGALYARSGWEFSGELNPGYYYTNYVDVFNRQGFMKNKLAKKYQLSQEYLNQHTEWDIVQGLGFDRIWDCGKQKWIFKIN